MFELRTSRGLMRLERYVMSERGRGETQKLYFHTFDSRICGGGVFGLAAHVYTSWGLASCGASLEPIYESRIYSRGHAAPCWVPPPVRLTGPGGGGGAVNAARLLESLASPSLSHAQLLPLPLPRRERIRRASLAGGIEADNSLARPAAAAAAARRPHAPGQRRGGRREAGQFIGQLRQPIEQGLNLLR